MFKWFINHEWKKATRSNVWHKKVVTNILMGFLIFMMMLYLLALGLFVDVIIKGLYPDQDPVRVLNGFLIYYFLIDLIARFYLQQVSAFTIESYLHLPVKRSTITHYVVLRTITSIFNYLPLFVFIPFAVKVIAPDYSVVDAWIWILTLIFLVFTNNLIISYLKRQLGSNPRVVGVFAIFLAIFIFLDYFNVISLSSFSTFAFGLIFTHQITAIIPVIAIIGVYILNYHFLRNKLYSEEINIRKHKKIDSIGNIRYLRSIGITGELIALEMKLMWRNKRTRTIIYMLPIFVLYGFFFYPQEIYRETFGFLIFVGVFMTGGMMLNYANYAFGWESSYFDTILTNNISIDRYLKVKFFNSVIVSTICYIITIPYLFFGWEILLINTVTFLYNIGLLVFVLLYMATYNKKRMDLSKGSAFNYQGVGASNWLAMIPAFLLPVFIYLPFSFAGYKIAGLMAIGVLGLIGLIFHKSLLKIIKNQFLKRKYMMAEGFRER